MNAADFLVVGAGIIGISVARELRRRHPDATVQVLEKERACGRHASGRNSGVLHAGFYYTADSLKARFTRDGNAALRAYCEDRGLPLNRCGKLVVARSAADHPQMDELLRRGAANGVVLESVTEAEARRIEPRVKTCQRAIFSPTTATADPGAVLEAMREDAEREGVRFSLGTAFRRRAGNEIDTSQGAWSAGYVVNCAGLHADRIARQFGFSKNYTILPFKGLYLYSDEPVGSLRTNIYPVPDLRNPFLGVHFTVTVDGHAKIGPTAIPAFWREQYEGLGRLSLQDLAEITRLQIGLLVWAGFEFRRLAVEELAKYSRRHLVGLAGGLAEGVRVADYRRWGRSGIRAQLLDIRTRKLEMDFVLEGDGRSMHVLNAVSPGWTCSIPFAAHVVDRIEALGGNT
ncbi:MAG: L-2-hydroxyglutarate oxidase [Planctomycetia bacterium]|nr:L-2-hydroxyglutarate oxidase [Planctomycetia bacterium]